MAAVKLYHIKELGEGDVLVIDDGRIRVRIPGRRDVRVYFSRSVLSKIVGETSNGFRELPAFRTGNRIAAVRTPGKS